MRDDLRSHASAPCTLAYWHHARFSSGMHGDVASVEPLWRTVHEMGVDVVFAGHDHHYERFAPLSVNGEPDPAGVVSFIVGTGGASAYRIDARRHAGSEVALAHTFGVVEVELGPGTYTTRFLAIPDGRVLDEFTGTCR